MAARRRLKAAARGTMAWRKSLEDLARRTRSLQWALGAILETASAHQTLLARSRAIDERDREIKRAVHAQLEILRQVVRRIVRQEAEAAIREIERGRLKVLDGRRP